MSVSSPDTLRAPFEASQPRPWASVEQAKRYIDLGVKHFCIGWDRFIYRTALLELGEGMKKLTEGL